MNREPTAVVKTHVTKTERDRLRAAAEREGRSIAGQVAYLIRVYLAKGDEREGE